MSGITSKDFNKIIIENVQNKKKSRLSPTSSPNTLRKSKRWKTPVKFEYVKKIGKKQKVL